MKTSFRETKFSLDIVFQHVYISIEIVEGTEKEMFRRLEGLCIEPNRGRHRTSE